MKPGEERDGKVVRLEDKGQLTTWQGKKGRERTISTTRSEGGSSPARKRRSSPSSSPRDSSKASRTTEALDHVAVDNNRNGLPSAGWETDGGEVSSSPSPSPETLRELSPLGSPLPLDLEVATDSRRQEEDTDDGNDSEVEEEVEENWALQMEKEERPEAEEEVIEELRRRLAHKATGPPPVYRVRALGAFEARAEDELSFQPGSIITVHRLSEMNPGWIVGFLDGKKGYMPANTMACLGNSGGLKRDLLEVIRTEV